MKRKRKSAKVSKAPLRKWMRKKKKNSQKVRVRGIYPARERCSLKCWKIEPGIKTGETVSLWGHSTDAKTGKVENLPRAQVGNKWVSYWEPLAFSRHSANMTSGTSTSRVFRPLFAQPKTKHQIPFNWQRAVSMNRNTLNPISSPSHFLLENNKTD